MTCVIINYFDLQNWLNGLKMLAIHRCVLLNPQEVINEFALESMKPNCINVINKYINV